MTGATDFIAASWCNHKEKPAGRVDDPDLAEKMKAEVEGILLWAFDCSGWLPTTSSSGKVTAPEKPGGSQRDNNNVYDFRF